jgi:hypothetical protein
MKESKKEWISCIPAPKLFINNCNNRFFGFDERKDCNGDMIYGFFVDIETYDEKKVFTIFCKLHVHCILWTDEHGRIEEAFVRRKDHPNLPDSVVLLIENSDLKEWFLWNSGGIFDDSRDIIKHYQIWSTEDCIDVLCESPPVVFEAWKECSCPSHFIISKNAEFGS